MSPGDLDLDFSRVADLGRTGFKRHVVTSHAGLSLSPSGLRFAVRDVPAKTYANAQIDDYKGLPRRAFPWSPPLTLTVRARFSHGASRTGGAGSLLGTAGFGFWNDPFLMTDPRPPALPRAIWFFYGSPPGDLRLDTHLPGHGWKAMTIDALRPAAIPWVVAAPVLIPAMNLRRAYQAVWPHAQAALRIAEALVTAPMTGWHTYTVDWGTRRAQFRVDGQVVLDTGRSPRGPLGFVAWCDNQYMIARPWGRLGWGTLPVAGEQWLEIAALSITRRTEATP